MKNSRQDLLSKISKLGIEIVDVKGDEACCRCPKHDDSSPSFFFNLNTEAFHCFLAGTKIIDANSGNKNIEDIVAGDYVLSYNEKTSEKEPDRVVNVFEREASNFVYLKFSNGNELICTEEHPIYVVGKGWIPAAEIIEGNEGVQYCYNGLNFRCISIGRRKKSKYYRYLKTRKHREKFSNNAINRIANEPNYLKNNLKGQSKEEKSANFSKMNKETDFRKRVSNRMKVKNPMFDDSIRKKVSDTKKKQYQDPIFASKMIKALHTFPNKKEKKLGDMLESYFPQEFKYVGSGEVIIGGKNPDFININGKKKIIELFGDHWHKGENPENRINDFKAFGYETIVVWESELKDMPRVVERVKTFLYNPNIEIVKIVESQHFYMPHRKVYNIETEKNNNYFAYGILVHNCFAGCIKGRGIHQLIMEVTGVTQSGKIIEEPISRKFFENRERDRKIIPSIPNLPLAINNKGQDYLVGRGFYPETISNWSIRYWDEEGAVVIPIEDKGYALRFLDKNRKPKYKYITGTRISETLFGLNKLPKTLTNIILVEGSLDCIYMHQLGFTNTLALLHADISLKQLKILGGITDYVYIMLDGDKAGRDASEKIKILLNHRFIKKICYLPEGKDPDNMKKEEIEKILKEAR